VLSVIQPALIQIARNAVAHGIESQEERKANGKPPAGRISVSVHHSGGRIVFTCRDDGRGINLEAVRRAARERGLPEQQAAGLTSDDILHLLLGGGLSTAKSVTAISGRGIGLDIVREAMEQLDGKVSFQTDRHGTSFDLSVPMSLFSLDAILVEAGDFSAALPLGAVQGALRLAPNQISAGQSTLSVVHDGAAYSFLPLSAALLGKPAMLDRTWQGLLVSGSVGSAVVGTDRLLGTARIVSRPLPQAAPASEIVSGTWFDASGNPQLVLDPAGLVSAAHRASVSVGEQAPRGLPILVVDDSLTSRTLEQSILESEGFDVDAAASAEEGLQAARRRKYGLFLVDVDMPGMSGFEFVETVRGDAELRDIPAVMVTSRSSPEDRARGRNAGAQGYIVKGEFDQVELLALIRSLIG
jgi:two-component system chemotaxis sensor kinase CheA